MRKFSKRNRLLAGLTLFSMFFGAGNLIFPPYLGAQAGTQTWTAMAGFAVTAIGFPVMGVVAVARAGGLDALAGRVHPKFAFWFTLLIYLSIGPCLAIPRTASTSFEMAVLPFMREGMSLKPAQAVYSTLFFVVAYAMALRPDKLTDRLGKILTPCLLSLITVIFAGCILNPAGSYGPVTGAYERNPLIRGFLEGYLTMDTMAALNFGIIISLNIRAMGTHEEPQVIKETICAGFTAGAVLLLVYSALAHIGAITGGAFGVAENGARTLNQTVRFLFGGAGMVMLALIFFIACLNTCVGLISCCSKYFCTILPGTGYRGWAFIFAAVSWVISNIGLSRILEVSVPVLNAIYPAAIVLILLSFLDSVFGKWRGVYPWGISFTAVTSIFLSLEQSGLEIAVVSRLLKVLPLYETGLAWVVPGAAGVAVGIAVSAVKQRR